MKKRFLVTYAPVLLLLVMCLTPQQPLYAANFDNPGLLPSNPFYFMKEWGRDIKNAFIFNDYEFLIASVEILDERAAELSKLIEIIPDNRVAFNSAVSKYNQELYAVISRIELLDLEKMDTNIRVDYIIDRILKHIQFFDSLPEGNKTVKYQINALVIIMKKINNPQEVRRIVRDIIHKDTQFFKELRAVELLYILENRIDPHSEFNITRLSNDLLIDFAADIIVHDIDPDIVSELGGNYLSRLQALDDVRVKMNDPRLKSVFSLMRQSVLKRASNDGRVNGITATDFVHAAQASLDQAADLKNNSSLSVDFFKQANFHQDQAERFLEEKNYIDAIGQASMAIIAAKNASFYSIPFQKTTSYADELTLLKKEYESLKVINATIQNKINDLSRIIIVRSTTFPSKKVEDVLWDLGLLISELALRS